MHVNGLTGQGAYEFSTLLFDDKQDIETVQGMELRFPMPSALCSYCLGERRIGSNYQMGNVRKMNLDDTAGNNIKDNSGDHSKEIEDYKRNSGGCK